MIRGIDAQGTVILGITRTEVDGIMEGKPCYFTNRAELGGGPVIVLWYGENDDELIARLRLMFASGPIPIPLDLRTRKTHGVIFHARLGP